MVRGMPVGTTLTRSEPDILPDTFGHFAFAAVAPGLRSKTGKESHPPSPMAEARMAGSSAVPSVDPR